MEDGGFHGPALRCGAPAPGAQQGQAHLAAVVQVGVEADTAAAWEGWRERETQNERRDTKKRGKETERRKDVAPVVMRLTFGGPAG